MVKAVDCKSTGQPSLVRIRPAPIKNVSFTNVLKEYL